MTAAGLASKYEREVEFYIGIKAPDALLTIPRRCGFAVSALGRLEDALGEMAQHGYPVELDVQALLERVVADYDAAMQRLVEWQRGVERARGQPLMARDSGADALASIAQDLRDKSEEERILEDHRAALRAKRGF